MALEHLNVTDRFMRYVQIDTQSDPNSTSFPSTEKQKDLLQLLVTELKESDNAFWGKSKVLSTPCGQILRALINDGVKIGMSTRALGSLQEQSEYNLVQNMHLVAVDAVADPSFPKAFVNGILESKTFVAFLTLCDEALHGVI